MAAPRRHDPLRRDPARGLAVLALALLLPVAGAGAEPLLTDVLYAEGSVSYDLFNAYGQSLAGPGRSATPSHLLRAGMAVPSATRIDTAGDARVLLSPSSQIKYLVFPESQVVNQSFSFNSADFENTLDYRIELVHGNLVGDVQGPLRHMRNQVATSQGTASTGGGHFLVAIDANGNGKYAVLAGTLTVAVTGHGSFVLGPMQVLKVLSEGERKRLVDGQADADAVLHGPRPLESQQAPTVVGALAEDLQVRPLDPSDAAYQYLVVPFPTPNPDPFPDVAAIPTLPLQPGQDSLLSNPVDIFTPNPANTQNNPPVSPIIPIP